MTTAKHKSGKDDTPHVPRVWQGFLAESKLYMDHPDHWEQDLGYSPLEGFYKYRPAYVREAKLKFWRAFPKAWMRFYGSTLRYWFVSKLRVCLWAMKHQVVAR